MNTWRLLVDDDAGASAGLALDEALMAGYARGSSARPPSLRLYTYQTHCALVGRYQHLPAEVDLDACRRTGTAVSRRPTGGGAIVMGRDQLGVAVVDQMPPGRRPRELLERFSAGVVAGLAKLGVRASFRGKNDLECDGRKIAGLGLYADDRGALLFHASVLADLDVPYLLRVLRIPTAKLAGKAVDAVAERVTTVTRLTGEPHCAATIRPAVAAGFEEAFGVRAEPGEPDATEVSTARRLERERYGAAEWLDQRSPVGDGVGSVRIRTGLGMVGLHLSTHGEVVKSSVFSGDFNVVPPELVELEKALRWRRLTPDGVRAAVARTAADAALGLPADQLVGAVLAAAGTRREPGVPVRTVGSCYFPDDEKAENA